jgi:hypothetical protein
MPVDDQVFAPSLDNCGGNTYMLDGVPVSCLTAASMLWGGGAPALQSVTTSDELFWEQVVKAIVRRIAKEVKQVWVIPTDPIFGIPLGLEVVDFRDGKPTEPCGSCWLLHSGEAFFTGVDAGVYAIVGASISGGVYVNREGWGDWGEIGIGVGVGEESSYLFSRTQISPDASVFHGYAPVFASEDGASASLSAGLITVSASRSWKGHSWSGSAGVAMGDAGVTINPYTHLWIWPQGSW